MRLTNSKDRILMLGYLILKTDPRVLREADALQKSGYQVEVISLSEDGSAKTETLPNGVINRQLSATKYRGGSTLHYLWSYFVFALFATFSVFRLGFERFYNAVHVHTMPDLLVFCALPAKIWGTKIVLDIHDTVPEVYQDKFNCEADHPLIKTLLWCEKIAARFADRVITVNYEHCELVHRRTGLADAPAVIFNAVDQQIFFPSSRAIEPPLKNLIVHGTLSHRHGIDILIRAFERVIEEAPETKLKIYGSGDAVPELRKLIDELGLDESIFLSGQYHPLEDMAQFVRDADMGIIPYRKTWSTKYMMPTKLLEYLSTGLAVVTCKTLPVSSMFGEQLDIWEGKSPESLAAIILGQIHQPVTPELPAEMQWSKHQRELIHFYSELIGHPVDSQKHEQRSNANPLATA